MLSNAYFLAKFRFDTAENEPAKNLQNFKFCQNLNFANFADPKERWQSNEGVTKQTADRGCSEVRPLHRRGRRREAPVRLPQRSPVHPVQVRTRTSGLDPFRIHGERSLGSRRESVIVANGKRPPLHCFYADRRLTAVILVKSCHSL